MQASQCRSRAHSNEQKEANGQEKVDEKGTEGVEHQGSQQPRTPADKGRLGAYQEALSASGAKSADELNKESEREVREQIKDES